MQVLTKSIADTHTGDDPDVPSARAYADHIDRMHAEVRWLPCSPRCANWLRFGVQPADPTPGLVPGACPAKAHDHEHLGLGGRRVLVSRQWSGKTLTEHKADRATVVREVLHAAGIDPPDAARMAADVLADDGRPRFVWEDVPARDRDYTSTIAASIRQAARWREQYEAAKARAAERAGPHGLVVDSHSAVDDEGLGRAS